MRVACRKDDLHGKVHADDLLRTFEPVHERHLDIEEKDVDIRMCFQKGEDFAPVPAFTDDFDAGDVRELIGQLAAGRQFVVGDKSTDFFHRILLLGKWVGV